MKRAILFTAITALILGMSGLRPAEAHGALNHGPGITAKVAKPGPVEKAHYRGFHRGRGHWFHRGRGHRFGRGRGHRRDHWGYHRHFFRLFSGAVVSRWHWHGWPGDGRRPYGQRRHHR